MAVDQRIEGQWREWHNGEPVEAQLGMDVAVRRSRREVLFLIDALSQQTVARACLLFLFAHGVKLLGGRSKQRLDAAKVVPSHSEAISGATTQRASFRATPRGSKG